METSKSKQDKVVNLNEHITKHKTPLNYLINKEKHNAAFRKQHMNNFFTPNPVNFPGILPSFLTLEITAKNKNHKKSMDFLNETSDSLSNEIKHKQKNLKSKKNENLDNKLHNEKKESLDNRNITKLKSKDILKTPKQPEQAWYESDKSTFSLNSMIQHLNDDLELDEELHNLSVDQQQQDDYFSRDYFLSNAFTKPSPQTPNNIYNVKSNTNSNTKKNLNHPEERLLDNTKKCELYDNVIKPKLNYNAHEFIPKHKSSPEWLKNIKENNLNMNNYFVNQYQINPNSLQNNSNLPQSNPYIYPIPNTKNNTQPDMICQPETNYLNVNINPYNLKPEISLYDTTQTIDNRFFAENTNQQKASNSNPKPTNSNSRPLNNTNNNLSTNNSNSNLIISNPVVFSSTNNNYNKNNDSNIKFQSTPTKPLLINNRINQTNNITNIPPGFMNPWNYPIMPMAIPSVKDREYNGLINQNYVNSSNVFYNQPHLQSQNQNQYHPYLNPLNSHNPGPFISIPVIQNNNYNQNQNQNKSNTTKNKYQNNNQSYNSLASNISEVKSDNIQYCYSTGVKNKESKLNSHNSLNSIDSINQNNKTYKSDKTDKESDIVNLSTGISSDKMHKDSKIKKSLFNQISKSNNNEILENENQNIVYERNSSDSSSDFNNQNNNSYTQLKYLNPHHKQQKPQYHNELNNKYISQDENYVIPNMPPYLQYHQINNNNQFQQPQYLQYPYGQVVYYTQPLQFQVPVQMQVSSESSANTNNINNINSSSSNNFNNIDNNSKKDLKNKKVIITNKNFLESDACSDKNSNNSVDQNEEGSKENDYEYGNEDSENDSDQRKVSLILKELSNSGKDNPKLFLTTDLQSLVEFTCTKKGSKMVQKVLEIYSTEEIDALYNKLLPSIGKLIYNQFGNYLVQNLLSYMNKQQVDLLIEAIKDKFISYSNHKFGNHSIQLLLTTFRDKFTEQKKIMSIIKSSYSEMAFNEYGVYVLQRLMEVFNPSICLELIAFVIKNTQALIKHDNGVCLTKKFIYLFNPNGNINSISRKKNKESKDESVNNKIDYYREKLVGKIRKDLVAIIRNKVGQNAFTFLLSSWGIDICYSLVEDLEVTTEHIIGYSNSTFVLKRVLSLMNEVS